MFGGWEWWERKRALGKREKLRIVGLWSKEGGRGIRWKDGERERRTRHRFSG